MRKQLRWKAGQKSCEIAYHTIICQGDNLCLMMYHRANRLHMELHSLYFRRYGVARHGSNWQSFTYRCPHRNQMYLEDYICIAWYNCIDTSNDRLSELTYWKKKCKTFRHEKPSPPCCLLQLKQSNSYSSYLNSEDDICYAKMSHIFVNSGGHQISFLVYHL